MALPVPKRTRLPLFIWSQSRPWYYKGTFFLQFQTSEQARKSVKERLTRQSSRQATGLGYMEICVAN